MTDPVAFTALGHAFRWYGILVAAGFLCACVNWNALDRRAKFPSGFGNEFGFIVMTGGLLGSRLAHVLGEWRHYSENPGEIFSIGSGGMTFYGGLLLGFLFGSLLARMRNISVVALADYGVPGLVLGHGIGRIGCFLNGCCYGRTTASAIGVTMAGAHRLPVQLYEAAFNIGLCAFLNYFYVSRRKFDGQVLALYLLLYGAWRFVIEFFRADPRVFAAGLSSAQWTSFALIATGAFLFLRRPAFPRKLTAHV
jgi:prolipoprotein diacylglyceryl transferase